MTILGSYAPLYLADIEPMLEVIARWRPRAPVLRFMHGELEAAMAGGFLLLSGSPRALAAYRRIRTVAIVSDLHQTRLDLLDARAAILVGPRWVGAGNHLVARHACGEMVDYLEFGWARTGAH